MDGRNNQLNPHNTQNGQQTNAISAELNHLLQSGVTPEQFAENARQLEAYSRMNAMALRVYLERQSQQAEQRRQDELHLVQLAQRLASGSQQQLQRQLPPPAPLLPHARHSLLPQQTTASSIVANRNVPVQLRDHGQSYHTTNAASSQHWSHRGPAHMPIVQHHQPYHASAPSVTRNVYLPREANRISQLIGGGGLAGSTRHTSQIVRPTQALPYFVQQTPLYPQHSGVTATGSQANMHSGASGATSNHGVHHSHISLNEQYSSWVKAYGPENAASIAREHLQLLQQGRQQIDPLVFSTQSTAQPTPSVSAQNLPDHRQSQIPKQEEVAAPPLPHPQTQEWHSLAHTPQQVTSSGTQPHPAVPSSHVPPLHPSTDDSTVETVISRPMLNTAEVHSHHLEATASNPAVTSTDFAPTTSVLPSSQSSSTRSILLDPKEKGTSLYTMHGLAASIKRSLNAERLAASAEPSASSDSHGQKRKRSNSAEAIDTLHEAESSRPYLATGKAYEQGPLPKVEPRPVEFVTEPNDSPLIMPPVSFPEVSISQQQAIQTQNRSVISSSQHDSAHNFIPFSTLTGAVSFDNIADSVPARSNATPSLEATDVLEDLTTAQLSPENVLHDHIEIPFIPVSQPSFDPLSFPHRTPTPPLAATIAPLRDEDEVDEKVEATHSSRPSTPLHGEVDSQLQLVPSGSDGDVEMSVASDGDQVRTDFNGVSLSGHTGHSEARDNNSPMQEADVFVRRAGLLDSSIGGIDGRSIGSLGTEECPAGEANGPAQAFEEASRILTKTSTRLQNPDSAETLGSGSLLNVPRTSRGKQEFYIAVPPPSEWVLKAKQRETERKARGNEKTGQRSSREYMECELANCLCPRLCHWNACQAVLNSMYALKQHVRRHQLEVVPVGPTMTVSCRWKQCRMVCEQSSLLLHLHRHIDKEVACIYEDCDQRFSRIQDLAEHERREHADDEPPPSAVPRPPDLKSPVALPQIVPSYTVITPPASKPSITAERHARLGPWTLGMINGHPIRGPDGNTALRARRTTRLTDKALDVAPMPTRASNGESGETTPNSEFLGRSAEYSHFEEPSVASRRFFEDLDTVDVTREFYDGSNVREESPWLGVSSESVVEMDMESTDSLAVEALL